MCPAMLSAIATLLHWLDDWTILKELLVVWLATLTYVACSTQNVPPRLAHRQ